tara:strand:- start:2182 stop:3975 length:1794 start_codon:yes stop_codon:yes gene_type:complete
MSTYSNLSIELIGTGEQDGSWGTTTNVNLGTTLEEAIVGTTDQAVTASNLTLPWSTSSNATAVARHLRINLTGSAGGASNLIVPTLSGGKNYYIKNSSNTAVTVKTASGSGILVPAGKSMSLFQDATNVVEAANYSVAYTIASGVIDNTTIGVSTASTGAFTTLAASSTVSGAGVTARFATPGPIGNTAPSTGAFTTLAASGAVSGAGITARFATPGPIGNTSPSTGAFTTLAATTSFTSTTDATINGLTVGKGTNAVASNTVLGVTALDAAVTGANNVAIGLDALTNSTSGYNNVAMGSYSMQNCVGGHSNTAVGYAALTGTALSATGNVAMGFQAANDITSGASNVAIGYNAMYLNTTATSNVCIGASCGDAINTGSYNTLVGTGAGGAITTAAAGGNVMMGNNAGQAVTTGGRNVMIGSAYAHGVGKVATGTDNVFIGTDAANTTTTGSNDIVLGYAATSSAVDVSNEITLGNASIGALRCQVTSIAALSDERDKTDIVDSPYGVDFVNTLKPRQFKWDSREGNLAFDGETKLGFVAQELLEATDGNNDVLDLVYESNPEKLEAKYGNLIPVLTKAIQELSAKVDELETKLKEK